MKPLADELDQLGELLGQDHDLAVLRHTVLNEFPRAGSTATLPALEFSIGTTPKSTLRLVTLSKTSDRSLKGKSVMLSPK